MKYFRLISLLLLASAFASCNQGTTALNNGGGSVGQWTIPGVGTVFVYELKASDSIVQIDTIRILATRQNTGGKSNVVRLVVTYLDHTSKVGFYNIEPNGDFSLGDSSFSGVKGSAPIFSWQTFPTGSKLPISDPAVDTFKGPNHLVRSSIRAFIAIENITVPAGSFSALHVRETWKDFNTRTDSLRAFNDSTFETTDFWFEPSLGLFVKETDTTVATGNFRHFTTSETDLIKYLPR